MDGEACESPPFDIFTATLFAVSNEPPFGLTNRIEAVFLTLSKYVISAMVSPYFDMFVFSI